MTPEFTNYKNRMIIINGIKAAFERSMLEEPLAFLSHFFGDLRFYVRKCMQITGILVAKNYYKVL